MGFEGFKQSAKQESNPEERDRIDEIASTLEVFKAREQALPKEEKAEDAEYTQDLSPEAAKELHTLVKDLQKEQQSS